MTLTDFAKHRMMEFEYSTIYDLTPALFCVASADGRFLKVNAEWERVLGFSKKELLKIGYAALIHPDDVKPTMDEVTRQLSGHSTISFVNRYRHKNGSYRLLEWQAAPANNGVLYAAARDITESKLAHDQLLKAEQQYHTLFDAIDEGFCIIEVIFDKDRKPIDYRFLKTNPSFERQTGLIDAQGKTMRELAPKHEDYWFEIYGGIAVTGKPTRFVNRAEQLHRWYDVYAFRIDRPEEHKVAILFNDITERRQMEQRMQRFTHEIIAAREDERRQLASALHHDVGSVAVGMSAYIDAIQEELRSNRAEEALRLTKRARKLFEESVARFKDLAVQLRPPELDVLGLRAALRHHFSQVTKRNGIRIQFRETLGTIRIPASVTTTLFRIAQEALTNAIKHGHAKQVDVRLDASKEDISLSVHDNGKGFNCSAIGDQGTSSMGLRVMQEMAAFAGGEFSVDSRPGRGTAVRVSLPRRTAAPAREAMPVRKKTVPRGNTVPSAGRRARARKRSRV